MEDGEIVEMLFERDENALDMVRDKYSYLYIGMLRQTLSDENDIEECANDVLLSLWRSIPPTRPRSLPAFISSLARRIGIDRYRYNTRPKRGNGYTVLLSELQECLGDSWEPVDTEEEDREWLGEVLTAFLRELNDESRILFVRRYYYMENVKSLAKRFGLTENYVSVNLCRTRRKLKKRLEKEALLL